MSRDIEDRLRAAYAARADTVTESSLRVAEPPTDEIQPIGDVIDISSARRRWITPALAAAAVAALAIGTSIALTVRSDHHHASPAVTPSTIAPTLPSPVPSPSVPHQSPTTGAATSPAPTASATLRPLRGRHPLRRTSSAISRCGRLATSRPHRPGKSRIAAVESSPGMPIRARPHCRSPRDISA